MSQQKDITVLSKKIFDFVKEDLLSLGEKYGYEDSDLQKNLSLRPVVLVLGNYSSGKSTLINQFLGCSVQNTGQAPTDDCFTVIINENDDSKPDGSHGPVSLLEEREGSVLVSDKDFPFGQFKKFGQKFVSHFRFKKVIHCSKLGRMMIIDTPGMLDSVSEKDRGYDYQKVVGEFARIADIVLILFDPHKAGTIRESYASLRETLPDSTYEDRMIFVLNRIDECGNLNDLLRVYGTLCWNVSQMTGRKDIPRILLTYSRDAAQNIEGKEYLRFLDNQLVELENNIIDAPKKRLDHVVMHVDDYVSKLKLILEMLQGYFAKRSLLVMKFHFISIFSFLLVSALFGTYIEYVKPFGVVGRYYHLGMVIVLFMGGILLSNLSFYKIYFPIWRKKNKKAISEIELEHVSAEELQFAKDMALKYLRESEKISPSSIGKDLKRLSLFQNEILVKVKELLR